MTDRDTPDADGLNPTAGWSERRRRHELEMEANTKRALELLATQQPRPVVTKGKWAGFKRGRVLVRRVRW